MPFEFERQRISDIILVKPRVFGDERGFFMESYKKSDFVKNGITPEFVQDNHSKSTKNVIRGLHFQKDPKAQGKLLRCIKGKIFDVGVDIRKGSPTFGQWCSAILSEENRYMFYIPAGFAHGFSVLSDEAEVMYKATEEYSPENDRNIKYNDPSINVDWQVENPIISDKDNKAPILAQADINFTYNNGEN